MKDVLGFDVNVNDVILFPSSGYMEEGIVIKLIESEDYFRIKTKSGYIKTKRAQDVICKTGVENTMKEAFPERYI